MRAIWILVLAALLLAAGFALTGCTAGSTSAEEPTRPRPATTAAQARGAEPSHCRFAELFAALDRLRRIDALCPTWLPDAVEPTQLAANESPGYTVEFNPPDELFPHVVLQLAQGEPSGPRLAAVEVNGREADVFFEPSHTPAGLHSGHYVVVIPGGALQQGGYWVSVHQDSQQSRRWNIELVLRIARSLRPIADP